MSGNTAIAIVMVTSPDSNTAMLGLFWVMAAPVLVAVVLVGVGLYRRWRGG